MLVNPSAPTMLAQGDASSSSGDDVEISNGRNKRKTAAASSPGPRKRNRKGAPGDAIVEAMLEIAAASKMRAAAMAKSEDRFSISTCIKVLDEIQGLDQQIYFFALDLFENPNARETFISLKSERRVTWLQGKSGGSLSVSTMV
ncbi:hypothetical protein C5167_048908 [Papaver somniferum]|uniref:Uncharacterized protein n=1 Tax=Papaver somniferum TaxID=3469 RepID=A0A4Y7KNG0_PAPSO|nr:uncharacterized protein LOC113304385 [Papaver somniferum]XP_026409276.1 uncharacterized protein LOC113304385 [Papaver somniferum]XP_026409277.1 uncharacterized protein LOC113304385 [Papaver somniferum]RZC73425.1 hypothetical protein C5167_048908 [Papaver somniferum]